MYGFHPYIYDYWELIKQIPSFFGVFEGGNLVAVNSGHATWKMYRSRGLYVHPLYRGLGLSRLLLGATIEQARLEKKRYVWSIPRQQALPAYEAAGFRQSTDWFKTETAELNCFVLLPL
jgi:GNAT superfamily N-acetyltransferase